MPDDCCAYGRCVPLGADSNEGAEVTHYERAQKFAGAVLTALPGGDFKKQVLASSLGSIAVVAALNPLFVLKVRVQNSSDTRRGFPVLINEMKSVYQSKGIRGFWSGGGTGLLMSIPNTVVYMSAYEESKILISSVLSTSDSSVVRSFSPGIAGALARMISVTAIAPFELVRTVQASGENKAFVQVARDVISANGIKGLYRGWTPTILRDCPFSAMYWYTFEALKPRYSRLFSSLLGPTDYSMLVSFASGSTAGLIAAAITHPYDVIKTQQQLQSLSKTAQVSNGTGVLSLYHKQGISGLYKGLGLRLTTVIPACGIVITVYEAVKSMDL